MSQCLFDASVTQPITPGVPLARGPCTARPTVVNSLIIVGLLSAMGLSMELFGCKWTTTFMEQVNSSITLTQTSKCAKVEDAVNKATSFSTSAVDSHTAASADTTASSSSSSRKNIGPSPSYSVETNCIVLALNSSIAYAAPVLDPFRKLPSLRRFETMPRLKTNDTGKYFVPPTLHESHERVLLSSVRTVLGDGLGHAMAVTNFELYFAMIHGLTYTHRVSFYSALTPKHNPNAIEDFFGWGASEINRNEIFNDCERSPKQLDYCLKLKDKSVRKLLWVTQIKNLPKQCWEGCPGGRERLYCAKDCFDKFIAKYAAPGTIFQFPKDIHLPANGVFDLTSGWFFNKYWSIHGYGRYADPKQNRRRIFYDPSHLHIAVHVRRGDFFNYPSRKIIPDSVYTRVVASLIKIAADPHQNETAMRAAMDREWKCRGNTIRSSENSPPVPNRMVSVHIYSEGLMVMAEGKVPLHDVALQSKVYVNEKGKPVTRANWEDNILGFINQDSSAEETGFNNHNVQVQMHIGEDTLSSLHHMIAADFFVGSASGMSQYVVNTLARGITVQPDLSQGYDPNTGDIRFNLLQERWSSYAQENNLDTIGW